MKSRVLWGLFVTGTLTFNGANTLFAAEKAPPGSVKFETCAGCHGSPGVANAYPRYNVPKLGGQHANYVVSALKSYASGSRRHNTMEGNALGLSEADMADIAAYLEQARLYKTDTSVTGDVKAGETKSESCAACHGEGGNSQDPNFPRLASQYESYMIKALKDYRSGKRTNAVMAGMANGLTDKDIEDIAAFYASNNNGLSVVRLGK